MSIVKNCFDNWIGVRGGCNPVTPGSGKYVDTLPGISLKMISGLTTEAKDTWKKVWEDVYEVALTEIESDFVTRGQSYFKTRLLLENRITGRHEDTPHGVFPENKYKGVAIEVKGSRYTDVFISQVNLFITGTASNTLLIYDYFSGKILDSFPFIPESAEITTIQVNKSYSPEGSVKKILLVWDANKAFTVNIVNDGAYYQKPNIYTTIRGAEASKAGPFREDNITFGKTNHGMTVEYSLNCSVEALMCSVKNLITIPLWYKLGEMLMNERLSSERLNYFTLVNTDSAKALRDIYSQRYSDSVEKVFNNLEVIQDGICYVCDKKRMSKIMIP